MDRSVRSRTSSTSSVRSPVGSSTPAPTPIGQVTPAPARHPHRNRVPSPDQLTASLTRLRAERGLSNPATPAPTPNSSAPLHHHSLHPDAILAGISSIGGDEGIASGSVPGTPAPTPFSPSPSVTQHIQPEQIAASIARLREEGILSLSSTQPTTPSTTPAYPPYQGQVLVNNLGIIPEHLAEGIAGLDARRDEGLDSGSNPCTPIPTPFSPSPAQHSVLAEQLAAGITRLKVEEGMSSGGSTGMPATPAPTPFSHGPGGVRPEDLAAGISRLSVIQEATDSAPAVAINVLDASGFSAAGSDLSNYFGSPAGDNIFDQLATPGPGNGARSRTNSNSVEGFHDVTIETPAKRYMNNSGFSSASPALTLPCPNVGGGTTPLQLGIHTPNSFPSTPLNPNSDLVSSTPTDLLSPASTISAYATPEAPTPVVESKNDISMYTDSADTTPQATPVNKPKPGSNLVLAPPPSSVNRPESPACTKSSSNQEQDAWIPTPACKEVLESMATTPGTYYPTRDQLTCPGVSPGSEQGDPVRDLVAKYQGEGEACKRRILAADGVTTDTRGLQQLIAAGNFRAAINLTAQLLEMYGQGKGKVGQLSKHSPTSLQIWFTRLALLVKLKLFTVAESEVSQFGDLDKPDLFFQYYTELYGGRRGSMVPWSLRLLAAQIPGLNGKPIQSFNKLFTLLFSVREMLKNLEKGMTADGNVWLDVDEDEKRRAEECWAERERQVLYSLINNSILSADYDSAIKCLDLLLPVEKVERKGALHAAYGRLYLQLGNISKADECFVEASKLRDNSNPQDQLEGFLDSAFLAIGQGLFESALERFQSALVLSSGKQDRIVRNNISVCLLYLGRLKEGLEILENSITSDTANIQGNPILNLCTLYELESSYALQKKIGMLGLVAIHSPDSFPTSSLKL